MTTLQPASDGNPLRERTIVRSDKSAGHFTQIANELLRDERLSYRARGIGAAILSRPDDWTFTADRLTREGREGRDAVRAALRELETFGYLKRRKTRDRDTGEIRTTLTFWEQPRASPDTGFQASVNQASVFQAPIEDGYEDERATRASARETSHDVSARALCRAFTGDEDAITDAMLAEAERILGDGRDVAEAVELIAFAQQDPFWGNGHVSTMAKLRRHYESIGDARDRQEATRGASVINLLERDRRAAIEWEEHYGYEHDRQDGDFPQGQWLEWLRDAAGGELRRLLRQWEAVGRGRIADDEPDEPCPRDYAG